MPSDFSRAALPPDAPLVPTARSVLAERLSKVLQWLDQPRRAFEDAETVHQLRVATRRAEAALRLFAPLLPRRRRRQVQKRLRRLRQAAGAVRDCDVHLAQAIQRRPAPPSTLRRTLQRRRQQAYRKLRKLRQRARRRLPRRVRKLLSKLAWRVASPPPTYVRWCLARGDLLARRFFRLAEQKATDDEALHQLRIAGKRLRYALELVAPALSRTAVTKLLAALHALQDRLGRLCDQRAAVTQLTELERSASGSTETRAFAAERKAHQQRLAAERRAWTRWWTRQRQQRFEQLWRQVRDAGESRTKARRPRRGQPGG